MIINNGLGIRDFWDYMTRLERDLIGTNRPKFPPYDIIHHKDGGKARIDFAVAGYSKDNLSVKVVPHPQSVKVLEVSSKVAEASDVGPEMYEHHGIARRSFKMGIPLSENWEVKGASLENGILAIEVVQVIPDDQKPVDIEIF